MRGIVVPVEPLPPRCPVLYLPGIDGTGRLLHRQHDLHNRFTVRCVSYPPYGPDDYPDLLRLAQAHLNDLGPAVVLAESFGGGIALLTALARPDLVRRLVLVNTFAHYPRRLPIDVLTLIGPWLPNTPSHPAMRRVRGWIFFGPDVPLEVQDEWWNLTADVPMRAYGRRFRVLAGLDLRPKLRDITVPALVFVSPNDWVVPPTAGRLLAKRLPRAVKLEIPAGHAAMIDPRVNVADWLESPRLWNCEPTLASRRTIE